MEKAIELIQNILAQFNLIANLTAKNLALSFKIIHTVLMTWPSVGPVFGEHCNQSIALIVWLYFSSSLNI